MYQNKTKIKCNETIQTIKATSEAKPDLQKPSEGSQDSKNWQAEQDHQKTWGSIIKYPRTSE